MKSNVYEFKTKDRFLDDILNLSFDTSFKAKIITDILEEQTNINVVNAVTSVILNDIKTYSNDIFTDIRRTYYREEYQSYLNPFRKLSWLFAAEDFLKERSIDKQNLAYDIAKKYKIMFYKVEDELTLEEITFLLSELKKALIK